LGEMSIKSAMRSLHRMLEQQLPSDKSHHCKQHQRDWQNLHSFSSIRDTGFATISNPISHRGIPHQCLDAMTSPRKIHEANGTKMCTALERGNATDNGICRST